MMALTACSGGGQTPASQAAAGSTQAAAADSQAEAPADQKEEPAAGEPKYGGQLRVTLNNDPASMDPLLEDSEPGQIPAAHILRRRCATTLPGRSVPRSAPLRRRTIR